MIARSARAFTAARSPWAGRGDVAGRLSPYRPRFHDRRFWLIQLLLASIAVIHFALESQHLLEPATAHIHALFLVPISLFFVPVVYAALTFGLAGAIATAAWATVLAVPNLMLFHDLPEQLGELMQLGLVDTMAVLAGARVDRELLARRRAEAATAALQASETKYRGLFDSSPSAILVLDNEGRVIDASPAAGLLFERSPDALRGTVIRDLTDPQWSKRLLKDPLHGTRDLLTVRPRGDREIQLEPAVTRVDGHVGASLLQVVLRDVTVEQQRQAGLRAYAAHVLRAQEMERKRIAQELHDETVQQVIMVCRQLDIADAIELPAVARASIREARGTAEGIVAQLRDFARALRPPALEDLGLASALRRSLAELSERVNIRVSLEIPCDERRLAHDVELALFRIAQEALHNVERHARAGHVRVTIAFGAEDVRLEVADDGIGFDVDPGADLAATSALGLLGMRERAEALGGRLEVRSVPQNGTVITATIRSRLMALSEQVDAPERNEVAREG